MNNRHPRFAAASTAQPYHKGTFYWNAREGKWLKVVDVTTKEIHLQPVTLEGKPICQARRYANNVIPTRFADRPFAVS